MKKTYVLDTNVLIQAPYAVECFEENTVVLPMTVLEELDNMKKEEVNDETNVLHYYLPYRECTDCPQRKVFIKNKEG